MKAVKRVASILISVILWAIILVAALFAFTTLATRDQNNVASVAGFTPLSVVSESMSPTFNAGDLIFIQKVDPDTLQVDDIVTFHTIINNEYALNTHRIVSIDESNGARSYTTKGDNNAIADTHIIANGDIVGKYVGRLGGFGKVMDFLSSSVGFLCVIVLPMLLFFIYQIYHLISVSIKLKKAVAIETAEEAAKASADADETAAMLAEAQRLKAEAEAKLAEAEAKLAAADQTEAVTEPVKAETEQAAQTAVEQVEAVAEQVETAETAAEAAAEQIETVAEQVESAEAAVETAIEETTEKTGE